MKLRLLCVGKPRNAAADTLFQDYAGRLRKLGVDFRDAYVPETRAGGRYSDAHVREREAKALREAIDRGERLITLDPTGSPLSSEQLAEQLQRWAQPSACFVIGGPLGLDPSLVREATASWSLGAGTFPHELARLLVAEQLYRAVTIRRGMPYHK